MGNTVSDEGAEHEIEPSPSHATAFGTTSYQWPENLYIEVRDMALVSFLTYSFGYILETARKVGLEGLDVDSSGHATKSAIPTTSRLARSFTPSEVKKILQDNPPKLAEQFPVEFADPSRVQASLELLEQRVKKSSLPRPLTLEEFDDKHQDREMVYAVTKDCVNKRITLCFRGTDNQLASDTNWTTNLDFWKAGAPVPDVIKEQMGGDQIWFHRGFYSKFYTMCGKRQGTRQSLMLYTIVSRLHFWHNSERRRCRRQTQV